MKSRIIKILDQYALQVKDGILCDWKYVSKHGYTSFGHDFWSDTLMPTLEDARKRRKWYCKEIEVIE